MFKLNAEMTYEPHQLRAKGPKLAKKEEYDDADVLLNFDPLRIPHRISSRLPPVRGR